MAATVTGRSAERIDGLGFTCRSSVVGSRHFEPPARAWGAENWKPITENRWCPYHGGVAGSTQERQARHSLRTNASARWHLHCRAKC